MGREVNRLSARKAQTLSEPGRHADGGGLYLVVDAAGGRRWVMLYRMGGKRREMGLGPVLSVPLAKARELAAEARASIAAGIDPIDARKERPAAEALPPKIMTFGDVAEGYMAGHEKTWTNPTHRRQWRHSLEVHAASLWTMPVAMVDTEAVLRVLRPLWHEMPETAKRTRGRIERVLNAARVQGFRSGENPALWRGHLDFLLPRKPKLTARGHHPALPYGDLPAFMAMLRARPATTARALEFIILTAARSGEVRGMTWGEVDLDKRVWTVPAGRMKMKREHRVPLTEAAVDLLRRRLPPDVRPDMLVFPNQSGGKLSDMAFEALLRRAKHTAISTHGFRSTFRDWAGDKTRFPRELAEAALAHQVGDETELAYRRSDALARRRHLMDAWAHFASGAPAASK